MSADKKTIGISKTNAAALSTLVAAGRFGSELDAAKFAMAYSIKLGIQSGASDSTDTKWNVGSVDPDGSLRSLLEALFPTVSEPYRLAEYLMNEGIRRLNESLGDGEDLYETIFNQA